MNFLSPIFKIIFKIILKIVIYGRVTIYAEACILCVNLTNIIVILIRIKEYELELL